MSKGIKEFYRGDTKNYSFDFGDGVDITGWKIYLTLKEKSDDTDAASAMQVFSTAGDNTSDSVLNGKMTLTASSIDTATLIPNTNYHYGFQRLIPGSPPDVKTLLTGVVRVFQDITLTTV
jgi:hypothetical protein